MQRRQLIASTAGAIATAGASMLAAPAGAQQTPVANAAQGGNPQSVPAHLQNSSSGPFATQPWGDRQQIAGSRYAIERVTYKSHGTDIVGNAFVPAGSGRKPAIVVIGPVAYVKEQSPMQYASRLVREGYIALAFDPRYHGESGGEPRRLESRRAKVEDLRASIDYLIQRPDVDAQKIHVLGVCQGVNWAIEASTLDPRVKALGLVAGHYLVPEVAALYIGSEAKVAERLVRAKAAREAFDQTGELRYIPIVSATDPQALLTAPVIREFYERWAYRGAFWNFHGLWENRILSMSEADIWGHQVDTVMRQLHTPTLMVHANRAASGPAIPRKLFEQIPAQNKELVWLSDQNQMQFYEDPVTIDQVAPQLARFFQSV